MRWSNQGGSLWSVSDDIAELAGIGPQNEDVFPPIFCWNFLLEAGNNRKYLV